MPTARPRVHIPPHVTVLLGADCWFFFFVPGVRLRGVRVGARAVGGPLPNVQGVELRQALQGPQGAR